MKHKINKKLSVLLCAAALASLSACSSSSDSPDDEATIIGTGVMLEGTATSNKLFASNAVELRSRTGERSTGTIDSMGRYRIETTSGSGPWLVRTDLGNNDFLYGIATDLSAGAQVQNIHSYSDAVVRSWYTSQNLDVDAVFQSSDSNAAMPTDLEANAIYDSLADVVIDVFDTFGIAGVNLNTAEFVANGGDVDKFILQNPVIRNNDSISVIVFDPLNNATSLAVDNFELANDITVADNVTPSAPSQLRALPSASDEITLVWQVATDNVGVARYAISRNGEEIATSPYPVFVDGGLNAGATNSYSVVAIDSTGNRSAPTVTVSAMPLATIDTTAPPAPASILIDTRRGSLDLEWSLLDVSDVASFVISRSIGLGELSEYTNVRSTFLFDEAVNAGVQYCYSVSAVDASGNASPAAGPTCAVVPGTVVSGGGSTGATQMMTSTDGLTAPQVDVSAVACTTEFPVTTISVDTTISAGCYLAERDIIVREPANLTLEPGVIIKFFSGERMTVSQGASLSASGTATNPIVLTGTETTPGHWDGLWIGSTSARNELDHVQIEYAGDADNEWGGLHFTRIGGDARVAVSNTTLRFNEGPGMTINKDMSLSSFDGNRYVGNAVPVLTFGTQAFLLDARSVYAGNTLDAVVVERTTSTADLTWAALPVPYHVEGGLNIQGGSFNVEPGTTIKFEKDARFFISTDDIELVGTEDAPITLSGVDASSGSWEGLFANSVSDLVLRNVIIQHAGADDQNSAIELSRSERTVFENVTITENQGVGVSSSGDASFNEFTNVTITANDGIANVNLTSAQAFNNAGNYLGNAMDVVEINFANASQADIVLSNPQVQYHSGDINLSLSSLTLEQGVQLFMREGTEIKAGFDSNIITNGTATQPVSIVGLERTPGFWDGIAYDVSAGSEHRFTNTLVADGGGDFDASAGNLKLGCRAGSQMTIENSQFENSAGYGIFVGSTNCSVTIDANTTFMGNALGDMN